MTIESFDYRDKIRYNDDRASKVVLTEADHARTTLWCLKPGQAIHPHVHAGDHVWVILEGEGVFLGEQATEHSVHTGTILTAPAGIAHGIRNTGQGGLVFASISAGG